MVNICSVCENSSIHKDNVSYFTYPKDVTRRNSWLKAVGRTDLKSVLHDYKKRSQYRICEEHFERKHIRCSRLTFGGIQKRLKDSAFPTLKLPKNSASSSQDTTEPVTPQLKVVLDRNINDNTVTGVTISEDDSLTDSIRLDSDVGSVVSDTEEITIPVKAETAEEAQARQNEIDNDNARVETALKLREYFEKEERPIMLLLKRLIRNKQNTVMTNTQIIEILKQEFDINVQNCHELEVDIYIKIIKKYLKDWPQWEELERISSKLSSAKDFDAVTKVLNHKYKNLKKYLEVMLEAATPLAKKAVSELDTTDPKVDNIDSSDVVMEVFCTREQLNHLFFRRPRSHLNNIFNTNKIEPTRISLNTLTFESVLRYWWTKVSINLPHFVFTRELFYKYKHTLINKARHDSTPVEELDTRMHYKGKKTKDYSKTAILKYFDVILDHCRDKNDEHVVQLLTVIFHVLKKDLEEAPDVLKVPASYKRCANKYKYLRYLYVDDTEESDSSYDLQLEEIIVPTYQFFIGRVGKHQDVPYIDMTNVIHDWLRIECMMCKVKFQGSTEMISVLQAHFNDYHQHEIDWQCQHCKRPFSMDFLAKNLWSHEC